MILKELPKSLCNRLSSCRLSVISVIVSYNWTGQKCSIFLVLKLCSTVNKQCTQNCIHYFRLKRKWIYTSNSLFCHHHIQSITTSGNLKPFCACNNVAACVQVRDSSEGHQTETSCSGNTQESVAFLVVSAGRQYCLFGSG